MHLRILNPIFHRFDKESPLRWTWKYLERGGQIAAASGHALGWSKRDPAVEAPPGRSGHAHGS